MEELERTCSRCARDFRTEKGHACVCPDCKIKPRSNYGFRDATKALTPRQSQVAKLVAEEHANKEIGFRLHLAEGTVKQYMSTIFKKLGVSNRTGVARHVLLTPAAPEPLTAVVTPVAFPVHLL